MRSGTCRMLKFSTNVYVPFLIYAVSGSAGLLKRNFKYETKSKIQMEWRGSEG